MDEKKLREILELMGLPHVSGITRFRSAEDDEPYNVWRIDTREQSLVLKQAKGYERETYENFLREPNAYAPRLLAAAEFEGAEYLLMEYVPGHDLMRCSREDLVLVLDSLIAMQKAWWNHTEKADAGQSFERSLPGRENRMQYLGKACLEKAYRDYLQAYRVLPRTLCHDDLLPFNVQISNDRATFIDWEYGGILPYPTSLARLIAHGEDDENAFFYMKEADKQFAVAYYYENLLKPMGITAQEFREALELCLFYEYCEWVYVGNKYQNTDNERFRKYLKLAADLANKMGYES